MDLAARQDGMAGRLPADDRRAGETSAQLNSTAPAVLRPPAWISQTVLRLHLPTALDPRGRGGAPGHDGGVNSVCLATLANFVPGSAFAQNPCLEIVAWRHWATFLESSHGVHLKILSGHHHCHLAVRTLRGDWPDAQADSWRTDRSYRLHADPAHFIGFFGSSLNGYLSLSKASTGSMSVIQVSRSTRVTNE